MDILSSNQTGGATVQPQDLAVGATGTCGNLRFTCKHGGTPRVGPVREILSNIGRSVVNLCAHLKFRIIGVFNEARMHEELTQHEHRKEAYTNSRHVGNLLGSLTALAKDPEVLNRIAARIDDQPWSCKGPMQAHRELEVEAWKLTKTPEELKKESPPPPLDAKFMSKAQIDKAKGQSRAALGVEQKASMIDAGALARIIQELARLGELSQGDLGNLPGGLESLSTYLREMTYRDLFTLRDGVLGRPSVRKAVLDQISSVKSDAQAADAPAQLSSDKSRGQAAQVLEQVEAALNERLAREVVGPPLKDIITLQAEKNPDGKKLADAFNTLHAGLAMLGAVESENGSPAIPMLEIYLKSLPKHQSDSLLAALNTERLCVAERVLSQNWEHLKQEAIAERQKKATSNKEKQQAKSQLVGFEDKEEYEPIVMLNRIRALVESEVYARVRPELQGVEAKLIAATAANGTKQKQSAVSEVLGELNKLVQAKEKVHKSLPAEFNEDVRSLVKDSLDVFRAASNPEGPLNKDSLRELDATTLNQLRHYTALHDLGLELVSAAAKEVGMERVEPLSKQLVKGMEYLVENLTREPVDMPVIMRILQDLSELETTRIQQLMDLGQFPRGLSVDDRMALAVESSQRMMEGLPVAFRRAVLLGTPQHIKLIKGWTDQIARVVNHLAVISHQTDYAVGAGEIAAELTTAHHLLNCLANVMCDWQSDYIRSSLTDPIAIQLEKGRSTLEGPGLPSSVTRLEGLEMPRSFYTALQELYGVVYDPEDGETTVLMSDSARAELGLQLQVIPSVEAHTPAVKLELLVDEKVEEFTVSKAFAADDERSGITFTSISGTGTQGQSIRFGWPENVPESARRGVMGAALKAISELVTGPMLEEITRLTNQQTPLSLHRSLTEKARKLNYIANDDGSLYKLLDDFPYRLEENVEYKGRDGSTFKIQGGFPFIPGGGVTSTYAMKRTEDGDIIMEVAIDFHELNSITGFLPDGRSLSAATDAVASWADYRFTLKVSPDVKTIDVIGLPRFRHHIELKKDQMFVAEEKDKEPRLS